MRASAVFPGEPAEVTLELNPGPLEVSRVADFVAAGVTRFSVGVQSLDDETLLRRLGRAQSGARGAARPRGLPRLGGRLPVSRPT